MDTDKTDCIYGGATSTSGGPVLRWFTPSAAVILAGTGLAKTWSAVGQTKALALPDPITGLAFGHLMLVVGLLELVVAAVCLFGNTQKLSLALVAWLATNFVVYRLGLWWMGWHKPCGCLGNLTDALHISPATADHIMKGVLAYLLIGSYWLLWRQWRGTSKSAGTNTGVTQSQNEQALNTGSSQEC